MEWAAHTFFVACRNHRIISIIIGFRLGRACTLAMGYSTRQETEVSGTIPTHISTRTHQCTQRKLCGVAPGGPSPTQCRCRRRRRLHPAMQRNATQHNATTRNNKQYGRSLSKSRTHIDFHTPHIPTRARILRLDRFLRPRCKT